MILQSDCIWGIFRTKLGKKGSYFAWGSSLYKVSAKNVFFAQESVCQKIILRHLICFQISLSPTKEYRMDHEFERTKDVLGKGNSAGDIIVVKDRKTGHEHAYKTVVVSFLDI